MKTRMHKDLKNRVAHDVLPMEYSVDAKERTLGRVASEAASALLGKKSVHYVKNKVLPVKVTIVNASKLLLPEKRVAQKAYTRYTGYPGGLRHFTLAELKTKKGIGAVIRRTVDGMIPRNKLRKERMKRLIITD
ncbi:uL13 family ribosomal protein [Candidatus Parcubacteria bacterium]|nr:uL13 family ribosomal protein [Candidatus Parcubacteria bacterium]